MQFFSAKVIQKFTILNQVALDSLKARSERTIIRQFVDAGVSVLNAGFGYSFVKDKETGIFRLVYKDPATPFISRKPRKRGTQATAYKQKRPLFISDLKDQQALRQDARQYMKSAVVIPMTYRKMSYGTINLCFRSTHTFNDEERTLCEYIGNSAAQAITIFRLLAEKKAVLAEQQHFLALASHELKSPITSMKAFSQTLLRSATRRGAPQTEIDAFQVIERQVNKLIKLMNDILDFSGFESGVRRINPQPVRVADLIESVRDKITSLYPQVQVHNLVGTDVRVVADDDRLEHVFMNLLANAIKYSRGEPRVTVSAEVAGAEVVVAVTDEGTGIAPAQVPHIFDPFFQANRSTVGGLGLGLYVSKKLVEQHGGRIWVDSVLNQGTTVYVSLPAATEPSVSHYA